MTNPISILFTSLLWIGATSLLAQEGPALGTLRQVTLRSSNQQTTRSATVNVVNNQMFYQGDICLGHIPPAGVPNAVVADGGRWLNSTMPYTIAVGHPASAAILSAINHINASTNLKIVPRTTEVDYVHFIPDGGGCWSYIGRIGGEQEISIDNGCGFLGIVAHELLHAAGIFHEQSREDRDTYVTIHYDNIVDGRAHNFDKEIEGASDLGPYNYASIMHYGTHGFSKNGQPTISIKSPPAPAGTTIGNRNGLSAGDIAAVNAMYPSTTVTCQTAPVFAFQFNQKEYEIVQWKKNWADAAACAVSRGGYLAHIDDQDEQDAIVQALSDAGIAPNYTSVPDGGGIAYVWIGATDKFTEGKWIWAGNGVNSPLNFWNGKGAAGSAVNNRYHRWGNSSTGGTRVEPDDFSNNQDAAGIALTNWPWGVAGEWNDINSNNLLYFVVEKGAFPCGLVGSTVTLTGTTSSSTTLKWLNVVGAQGYLVQFKTALEENWTDFVPPGPPAAPLTTLTSLTLTGLNANTAYQVRVIPYCGEDAAGLPSPIKSFQTLAPCDAPMVRIDPIGYTTAKLNWGTLAGILGYEVRYRKVNTTVWTTRAALGTASFLNLTGLLANTTYEYQIRLKCTTTNFSAYSEVATFATLSCDPIEATVLQSTFNSATIGWEVLSGVFGYEIRYKLPTSLAWTTRPATANATALKLTGLLPNKVYQYQIRLKCTATSFSPFSDVLEFETSPCPTVEPQVTTLTATTLTLGWTPNTGVVGYEVRYRKQGTIPFGTRLVNGSLSNSYKITGLLRNTTYEIQMASRCALSGNNSLYSEGIIVTTPALQKEASEDLSENQWVLAPNPTNGVVNLYLNCVEKGVAQIRVTNYLGQEVWIIKDLELQAGETIQTIDLSAFSNGIYWVQLQQGTHQKIQKILLNK